MWPALGERPLTERRSLAPLLVFGLVAARMGITGHAPAALDALFAALLCGLVAFWRPRAAALVAGLAVLATLAFVVGVLGSDHLRVSLLHLPTAAVPALAVVFGVVLSVHERTGAIWGLAVGGALGSASAVWQRLVTYPDALARRQQLGLDEHIVAQISQLRPIGLSLSPDLMGALAIAGAGACLVLVARAKGKAERAPAAALGTVSIFAVIASKSAGCLLAIVVGTAAALAMVWTITRRRKRLRLSSLIGVIAVGAIGFRGLDQLVNSAGHRLLNWQVAWDVGALHPFGLGLGELPDAYLALRTPETNVTRYAHSTLMQWWAELGVWTVVVVVALGAMVAWAIGGAVARERARRHDDDDDGGLHPARLEDAALVGTAVALSVRTLFDYDLQIGQTALVWGLVVGLCRGTCTATPSDDGQTDDDGEGSGARAGRPQASWVGLAFAGLTLVMGWIGIESQTRGEMLAPFERGADAPTDDERARLLRLADERPHDPRLTATAVHLRLQAVLGCQGGACAQAQEEFAQTMVRALADPRPGPAVWLAEGVFRASRNDVDGAFAAYARALEADPSFQAAHHQRVALAWRLDHPELKNALEQARLWLPPLDVEQMFERAGLPPD